MQLNLTRREFITSTVFIGLKNDNFVEIVKLQNDALRGLKILFITDIHISWYFMPDWSQYDFNLGQDITLLGGDYFYIQDGQQKKKNLVDKLIINFELFLTAIPRPAAAVLGNHDRKHHYISFEELFSKHSVSLLVNKNMHIKGINLFGSDDFLTGFPQPPTKETDLVVSHSPDYFEYFLKNFPRKILTLSGHTHGGQIIFMGCPFFLNIKNPKYLSGFFNEPWGELYVSRGLGTVLLPIRVGAPAEITLLEFI